MQVVLDKIFNLPDLARHLVLAVTILAVLLTINLEIAGKERIIRDGATVLLRIGYRETGILHATSTLLSYSVAEAISSEIWKTEVIDGAVEVTDGTAVIALGERNEASFVSLYEGGELPDGQLLLRFRKRRGSVRLAGDVYFFDERSVGHYVTARFGEIRVDSDGNAVLIAFRDETGERRVLVLHSF